MEYVRRYTDIGKVEGYVPESIDRSIAVAESEDWQDLTVDKSMPFSQGYAINSAIEQMRIPKVTSAYFFGTIGEHGFYGLQAEYKNGTARIYMADNGCDCVVVAIDFAEKKGA